MAYVLAVNPMILAEAGMDRGEMITATAIAAGVFSLLMGLLANIPLAQAPGMGANALFAYTLVLSQGIPWEAALGLVFWSGVVFLILTLTGVRQILLHAFPADLKSALTVGIGLFIAFIGIKNAGLVAPAEMPLLIVMGDLSSPGVLLALFGLVFIVSLMRLQVAGAILIGVSLLTIIGLWLPSASGVPLTTPPDAIFSTPIPLDKLFLSLDFTYLWYNFGTAFPALLTLVFLDLFSSLVAMNAMCQRAGLTDSNGDMENPTLALSVDACATIGASLLGTSTTNVYAESSAGIESGGRTGLTAMYVGLFFLVAMFITPLILIIPAEATAPALMIIGILMFSEVRHIQFEDLTTAAPSVIAIFLMPITSISDGLALGLISYVSIMLMTGRYREMSWLTYLLAGTLGAYYAFAV
ncbi:MAG: AGZA family xanthine/uracil permease-like MFS transporter [Candidatus Azotimanducaceae bacterium]|jgi:AGZA family xanthine/uracil permease-like MFS transporter